jgi:acyl-CoA oxidase
MQSNNNFSMLPLMHHLSAGMKAVITQETLDALFIIRQSLGGAGYSAWSGFTRAIDDYGPMVTFEGDNTVMS